jgi:hypothetical protein
MFRMIENHGYDTPFIGYANADILFDSELIRTLLTLLESYNDLDDRMIMVVGRRKNVSVKVFRTGACLSCIRTIGFKSEFYKTDAEDYFIFSRAGFRWNEVPEFIVGWPGYDNWLVANAIAWGITVIDASNTINAIHQVGIEGVNSGWNINLDPYVNLRLASPNFNYELGRTHCALWKTIYSHMNCPPQASYCVKLIRRHPIEIPAECHEKLIHTTESFYNMMLGHDY